MAMKNAYCTKFSHVYHNENFDDDVDKVQFIYTELYKFYLSKKFSVRYTPRDSTINYDSHSKLQYLIVLIKFNIFYTTA